MFLWALTFWLGMAVFGLFLAGLLLIDIGTYQRIRNLVPGSCVCAGLDPLEMRKRKRSRNTPSDVWNLRERECEKGVW